MSVVLFGNAFSLSIEVDFSNSLFRRSSYSKERLLSYDDCTKCFG